MWEGWKGCTRSPPGCGRPPPVLTGCVRASHAFHTRRRHSGVACGKGGKGVRAPIHLPHQAHRTRSARGRAFHASHRTPPRFLPHSGPQTRGTTPPAAGRRRRKPKPAANPPGLRHRRITDVPCLTPLHSHGESTARMTAAAQRSRNCRVRIVMVPGGQPPTGTMGPARGSGRPSSKEELGIRPVAVDSMRAAPTGSRQDESPLGPTRPRYRSRRQRWRVDGRFRYPRGDHAGRRVSLNPLPDAITRGLGRYAAPGSLQRRCSTPDEGQDDGTEVRAIPPGTCSTPP